MSGRRRVGATASAVSLLNQLLLQQQQDAQRQKERAQEIYNKLAYESVVDQIKKGITNFDPATGKWVKGAGPVEPTVPEGLVPSGMSYEDSAGVTHNYARPTQTENIPSATGLQRVWLDPAGNEVSSGSPGSLEYERQGTKNGVKYKQVGTADERASNRIAQQALQNVSRIRNVLQVSGDTLGTRKPITPNGPLRNWNPGISPDAKTLKDNFEGAASLIAMLRTGKQGEKAQVDRVKQQYSVGEFDDAQTILRRLNEMEQEIRAFASGELSSPTDSGNSGGSLGRIGRFEVEVEP